MKKFVKKLGALALAAGLVFGASFPTAQAAKEFVGQKVKLGLVAEADKELWHAVAEKAKKDEGIEIEITNFSDYNLPNAAVEDGSLDLNAFQHIIFLEEWNKANKGKVVNIGFTYVEPQGIYSEKVKSLDELKAKDGAKIAIPNDVTNQGRALLTLELAGLIEVDDAKGILASVSDVTKNEKNIKFEEVDASQTARSLKDVDAAVINGNYAADANLTVKDALFVDATDKAKLKDEYKNIIAVKESEKDNKLYKKVVEIFQSDEIAKKIEELSKNSKIPMW